MQPGRPRTKAETLDALKSQLDEAKTVSATNRVKAKRTETGIKDTYQSFFVERLLNAGKRRRGSSALTAKKALDDEICKLPNHVNSPVLRIRGMFPLFYQISI